MKIQILSILLLIKSHFCDDKQVKFFPSQSFTLSSNRISFFSQFFNKYNEDFSCYVSNRLEDFNCSRTLSNKVLFDFLLDLKYLKIQDGKTDQGLNYIFGTVSYKYLGSYSPKISGRLISMVIANNEISYNGGFRNMVEPPYSNFPDIECSASLIGFPDMSRRASNASLYILGGSKYISANKNVQMVKSFVAYDFNVNKWYDYTEKLPMELESIAGHEVANINNEQLAVLGGYRTKDYTLDQGKLSSTKTEFFDFKNIWVFNIIQQKWEYKSTKINERDAGLLKLRLQYSCAVEYYKNTVYVYAGFYIDSFTNDIVHLLGILTIDNWAWEWKQLQVNNSTYKDPYNTYYSSLLKEDYMIISLNNIAQDASPKFIGFNLTSNTFTNSFNIVQDQGAPTNSEPSDTISNTPSNTSNTSSSHNPIHILLYVILAIVVLLAIYILYKLYLSDRESKGYLPKFETFHIWSDLGNRKHQKEISEKEINGGNTSTSPNLDRFDILFNIYKTDHSNQRYNSKNYPRRFSL